MLVDGFLNGGDTRDAATTTVAPLADLPAALHDRFGGLLDRAAFPLPADLEPDERAEAVSRLRQA